MEKASEANSTIRVDVKILGFQEETVAGKKVTFYEIECSYSGAGKTWTVKRRFSEFEKLHEELKKTHRTLPALPGKTLFSLTNKDDLERRRKGLEDFIKAVVVRDDCYCKKEFVDFLDLESHSPSLATNQMQALAELTHSSMGYRDVHFNFEKGFAVAALHQVKLGSRIGSMVGGLFAKKKETTKITDDLEESQTVGLLQFLVRNKDSKEITDFEMLWQKKYPSQAICVAVSVKQESIAVGLDSGDIYLYKFDPSDPKKKDGIEEFCIPKAHSGRVMKMIYDDTKSRLYSIGDDKKLRSTTVKTRDAEGSLKAFEKGLTDFCYNSASNVAIIVDSGSNLFIVDLNGSLPNLVSKTRLSCSGPLRGLEVDWANGFIFVSSFDDGLINILKSNDISDVNIKPEEYATIQGFKNLRNILYWMERQELYVGYARGYLTVYKLDVEASKGKLTISPTYSTNAHQDDINGLFLHKQLNAINTVGKDKALRFWVPPASWKKDGATASLTQADIDKLGEDFPAPMEDKPPTTSTETPSEPAKPETPAQPQPTTTAPAAPAQPQQQQATSPEQKDPEVLPVSDSMPAFPAFPTAVPTEPTTTETEAARPTAQGEALLDPVLKENMQSGETQADANLNI